MNKNDLVLLEHHHQLIAATIHNENIPRQLKALLAGIASFFNLKNQCAFPSRKQLAQRTGYCVNHITDLIKQAVDEGFITSTAQFVQVEGESAPRQIANKYEFILSKFGLFYSKVKVKIARQKRKDNIKQEPNDTPELSGQTDSTHPASSSFDIEALKRTLKEKKLAIPPK